MTGRGSEEGAGPATAGESRGGVTGSCGEASATPNRKLIRHVQARTVRCLANRRPKQDTLSLLRTRRDVPNSWDRASNVLFLLALFNSIEFFPDWPRFPRFQPGARVLHDS